MNPNPFVCPYCGKPLKKIDEYTYIPACEHLPKNLRLVMFTKGGETMKPEPLKTIRVIEWLEDNSFGYKRKRQNFRMYKDLAIDLPEAIFIEDLQERVQGLLEEIEKEYEKEFKKNPQIKDFKDLNTYSYAKGFWNGVTYGLNFAIQKIKKWFGGVVE